MDFDCVRFGGFFSAVMFSFCEDKIAGNRSIKAKKKGEDVLVCMSVMCVEAIGYKAVKLDWNNFKAFF